MSAILSKVFQSMNIVVLRRLDDRTFQILNTPPQWLEQFCGKQASVDDAVQIEGLFPFLDCFLNEAEEFWESKVSTPHRSGPWVDFTPHGEEIPLEAIALWEDDKPLLILQDLGEEYYNEVVRLQGFRDGALDKELLESEILSKTKQIRIREEEIAMKLLSAAGHRDHETAEHVRRIGLYAEVIAEALNWDKAATADLRIAAPMHDIGKIGIPDRVLLKPGKLTEEEFEEMKEHAAIGADMLNGTNIPLLNTASEIAMCHHEKWDGSGYPRGLSGKEIPESARITTIVDVYDALVHRRVYKEASSEEAALKIMEQMVGKHFDPELYKVFLDNLDSIRRIKETYVEPSSS
jgi:HD-GYP domain-containing protein (c-di-GMP phosphodiesterase class II)